MTAEQTLTSARRSALSADGTRPPLSVVVPVYNQEGSIVENVRTIRDRLGGELAEESEIVVVSDGSIDRTEERLLESRSDLVRVIHYDRNLGKGYAVKIGALASRGEWVSFVDGDLDLDPGAIPAFLEVAQGEGLDFAIGSKRHPDSRVHYPRSRRVASWMFQQLVRLLFRLKVRDTQVGLKVFRREVADEVLPLLLVKRYAFDLELLAVSRALGFDRMREMPIALDYRFTGSGVRSMAVVRALIDTAAIFYRLRILRYYQRKRALLGAPAARRVHAYRPLVTLIAANAGVADRLDYDLLEVVEVSENAAGGRLSAAKQASGEVLAFLGDGALPTGNWVSSALPFLGAPEIAAVVTPTMAPNRGSVRERAAAAVWESRLGGGSLRFRFTPGNLRFVRDFPATNVVVRRDDYLGSEAAADVEVCERLTKLGKRVVYTPDAVVITRTPPLFAGHIRAVGRYAASRAKAVRRMGWRALRASTVALLGLVASLVASIALAVFPGPWRAVGVAVLAGYAALLVVAGLAAALRFRSLRVGLAATIAFPLAHAAYAASFVRGLVSGASPRG